MKSNNMTIVLPDANVWQGSTVSAFIKTGKDSYKEIVYRKKRDQKGMAYWVEDKNP